ncbi:MAG: rRNA pseudouridine synthase [Phycisphaerales bacterium]|nr:rRNA pseudouridine synthase [Phycisphaerales bacterium]
MGARRACERLIEEGRVVVNGSRVRELPVFVGPEDQIEVDGRPIQSAERLIYVMLNKPTRTLTTRSDEPGADRRTVADLVDHPASSRLFPVGRLDYDTTGLVIMTNDGALAHRLTHPRYGVPKTYRAVVRGLLDDENVRELEQGIYLAERREGKTVGAKKTAQVEISVHRRDRDRTTIDITLREGRNRQVRRMLASVNCPVKKLERIAMGPVRLKGLARGEWRELERDEIRALRKAVAIDQKRSRGPRT